jgi:hypothetical protein
VLAFIIRLVGRALDRRRQVIALTVVGVRRRTHVATQAVFNLLPLVMSVSMAVAVGTLVANALIRVDYPATAWSWTAAEGSLTAVVAALLIAALGSLTVWGMSLRPEDLRRE